MSKSMAIRRTHDVLQWPAMAVSLSGKGALGLHHLGCLILLGYTRGSRTPLSSCRIRRSCSQNTTAHPRPIR